MTLAASRAAGLTTLPRLMREIWTIGPGYVLLGVALRVAGALLPLAALWVAKLLLDRVVFATTTPGRQDQAFEIWLLLALEVALVIGADVLSRATELVDGLLGTAVTTHFSVRVIERTASLDLATLEDPECQDRLERARTQASARLDLLIGIGRLFQAGITFLSCAAAILTFSPFLFLLLVLSVGPSLYGEMHYALMSHALTRGRAPQLRHLAYLTWLGASCDTAKELRAYELGDYVIGRYARVARQFQVENQSLLRRRAFFGALLGLIGTGGYYLAYAVVLYRTLQGALSIGDLTFLAGVFLRSRQSLQLGIGGVSSVVEQAVAMGEMFAYLDMRPVMQRSRDARPAPRPIRRGIEFRHVSFRYPRGAADVLNDVSFRLEPGEYVALAGPNGAGKTTVVKLLTRLYDPTGGAILLDGVDLREYQLDDLHREMSVVFQDYLRYDMTVRENIGLGQVEYVDDLDRVTRAAVRSGIDGLINRLPGAYGQMLGQRFGGVALSGGEWQRIALARADMRHAQIVILDEPTAALDARAEHEIFTRFAEMTRGRTALVISHRLSTVRGADRIIVFDHGSIREQGSHDQLMARGDHYAELFNLQAYAYR